MGETTPGISLEASLTEADEENFETVISVYLQILDRQQNEIYNVRMMHHEVWRDVHQVAGISETRAGGRVERYTKILPVGARSDVDYKLCVKGVEVDRHKNGEMYFEPCLSKAYCRIYFTQEGVQNLSKGGLLKKFFRNSVRECSGTGQHIVVPVIFKTNVVEHCKFEMRETKETNSPTSPAVSGEGALNPYDVVPCLKLSTWPPFLRQKVLDMYKFRSDNGEPLSIFVVPTGNPSSEDRDLEWRLSFAILEIEIFRQLESHQRRLYGLAKYIFKAAFEEINLIQSYHFKILFLRKLEDDDLSQAHPLSFLVGFFRYVLTAVKQQYVPHLFVTDCNIYPLHYYTDEKKDQFRLKVEECTFRMMVKTKIKEIISHDTNVNADDWHCWLLRSKRDLEERQKRGLSESWVAGYLTRLLSVITYCLKKSHNQGTLQYAINNLVKLVTTNQHDKYVKRVIPHISCILGDVYSLEIGHTFDDTETQKPKNKLLRSCDGTEKTERSGGKQAQTCRCTEKQEISCGSQTQSCGGTKKPERSGGNVAQSCGGTEKPEISGSNVAQSCGGTEKPERSGGNVVQSCGGTEKPERSGGNVAQSCSGPEKPERSGGNVAQSCSGPEKPERSGGNVAQSCSGPEKPERSGGNVAQSCSGPEKPERSGGNVAQTCGDIETLRSNNKFCYTDKLRRSSRIKRLRLDNSISRNICKSKTRDTVENESDGSRAIVTHLYGDSKLLSSSDNVSLILHRAFFCYEKRDINGVTHFLSRANLTDVSENTLGITVTKFHKGIDQPLDYVINYSEEHLNSNRFYLYPDVLYLHMKIQICLRDIESCSSGNWNRDMNRNNAAAKEASTRPKVNVTSAKEFDQQAMETNESVHQLIATVSDLVKAANCTSVREPYTGKLSYRHSSCLLISGYREQFAKTHIQVLREIMLPVGYDSTEFTRKNLVTNFDLR